MSWMMYIKAWFPIKFVLCMYGQFTVRQEFDSSGLGGWKSNFHGVTVYLIPLTYTFPPRSRFSLSYTVCVIALSRRWMLGNYYGLDI